MNESIFNRINKKRLTKIIYMTQRELKRIVLVYSFAVSDKVVCGYNINNNIIVSIPIEQVIDVIPLVWDGSIKWLILNEKTTRARC